MEICWSYLHLSKETGKIEEDAINWHFQGSKIVEEQGKIRKQQSSWHLYKKIKDRMEF